MTSRLPAVALLLLCLICPAAAGTSAFRPRSQPLLVARLPDPAAADRLCDARIMRALRLTDIDHPHGLPGLVQGEASLRAFLRSLTNSGAMDVFFAVVQPGGSLASQTPVVGWRWPAGSGPEDAQAIADWVRNQGLDADRLRFTRRRLADGDLGVMAAAGANVLAEAGEAPAGSVESWRASLDAFMADDTFSLGLWFNPRPLGGILALFTGLDIRALAAGGNLNLPSSAELRVFLAAGDIGVALRLESILDQPWDSRAVAPAIRLAGDSAETTLVRLDVCSPAALLDAFGVRENALFPAGLDARLLLPSAFRLDLWRRPDGSPAWRVLGRVPENPECGRQLARLMAWLEVLAASPATSFSLSAMSLAGGYSLREMRIGDRTLRCGAIRSQAAGSYLVLAEKADDFPPLSELTAAAESDDKAVVWIVRPDATAVDESLRQLLPELRKFLPTSPDEALAREMLLNRDSGFLAGDGTALTFSVTNGAALAVFPILEELAPAIPDPGLHRDRLAEKRLRHLLAIASQSRFRLAGPDRPAAPSLPQSLAECAYRDADGRAWLDRAFPPFPGHSAANSRVLDDLATGGSIDGWTFAIVNTADGWGIVADGGRKGWLHIDATGGITAIGDE